MPNLSLSRFQKILHLNKREINLTEADKIILYTKNLINREDLIINTIKEYNEANVLSFEQRERAFIPIYIALESFIIRNKPLVVKQKFTKESLRVKIKQSFDLNQLAPAFRLIFLFEQERNILLFEQWVNELAKYIIDNIGLPHLDKIIGILPQDTRILFQLKDRELDFSVLKISEQNIPTQEIINRFRELYEVFIVEISKSLGATVAESVLNNIFYDIRKTYDYEIIAHFLEVAPQGFLENERIRNLGRDELEDKIQARTMELKDAKKALEQKLDLIKKQNDDLESTRQALLKSLQEAQRLEKEVEKEKEKVDKKVEERTIELRETMANLQSSYRQIENEKARFIASINNLSLGFIMTDINDNIIAMNQAAGKIIKREGENFKNVQDLGKYLDASVKLVDYCQKCKNEKIFQKIEEVNCRGAFLRLFFTPIIVDKENCIGVVIIMEDITEAKMLERSKEEFFAVASHDLRTPLTAIRGYSALILDNFVGKLNEDKAIASMVKKIHESSIRLIKLVNSFLDASRLEQGKVEINLSSFPMAPLIENVITELTQMANQKNIYLKFDNKEDMPNVYADIDKVKQVIFNLVGNAVKFTENGGISISMEKNTDSVKIAVVDTGVGISENFKGVLFRKFQQAGEKILTHDATSGSGMGLYISKLLVESMGGSIKIENSELGKGSTFAFILPIVKTG